MKPLRSNLAWQGHAIALVTSAALLLAPAARRDILLRWALAALCGGHVWRQALIELTDALGRG